MSQIYKEQKVSTKNWDKEWPHMRKSNGTQDNANTSVGMNLYCEKTHNHADDCFKVSDACYDTQQKVSTSTGNPSSDQEPSNQGDQGSFEHRGSDDFAFTRRPAIAQNNARIINNQSSHCCSDLKSINPQTHSQLIAKELSQLQQLIQNNVKGEDEKREPDSQGVSQEQAFFKNKKRQIKQLEKFDNLRLSLHRKFVCDLGDVDKHQLNLQECRTLMTEEINVTNEKIQDCGSTLSLVQQVIKSRQELLSENASKISAKHLHVQSMLNGLTAMKKIQLNIRQEALNLNPLSIQRTDAIKREALHTKMLILKQLLPVVQSMSPSDSSQGGNLSGATDE